MKDKILTFVIGALVGAIISTTGFLIYSKVVNNNSDMQKMDGKMEMPAGEMSNPPEKPDGDNGQTPPEKPEEMNNINNEK